MDNRNITVTSIGEEDFKLAMILAFSKWDRAKERVYGYTVDEDTNTLTLYHLKSEIEMFPFEMDVHDATQFALMWQKNKQPKQKEPPFDGSVKKAFTIQSHSFGAKLVSITPIWAMYGK